MGAYMGAYSGGGGLFVKMGFGGGGLIGRVVIREWGLLRYQYLSLKE